MGCDIHILVERKIETKYDSGVHDKWVSIGCVGLLDFSSPGQATSYPEIALRNYTFFAKLAGVRGHGPVAKGIPDDASDYARFLKYSWGVDGHSWSYDSLEQFLLTHMLCVGNKNLTTSMTRKALEGVPKSQIALNYFAHLSIDPENLHQYRVVYWFDN